MKFSTILEDDENIVVVPLVWLTRETRKKYLEDGYQVISIPGYQETNGYRAFKVIGPYSDDVWIRNFSIPIWEDWKLTAKYAADIERSESTTGQQMFDHLDDDEKIKAREYLWFEPNHPDLLKRAKRSLKSKRGQLSTPL